MKGREMKFTEFDMSMMQKALDEAEIARIHGDVPVGAVMVNTQTGEIISTGHNTREQEGNTLGHAEVNAVRLACEKLGSWRLSDCTLYVTLEPCPMCAGALLAARIPRIVYGAKDAVAGAMGSVWSLHTHPIPQSHVTVESGCMEREAGDMLKEFFKNKRSST